VTRHPTFVLRSWAWKRFHPLVRIGWITATAGRTRPATQTAIGLGLMGAGLLLRRSHRSQPIYTHVSEPGETVRIRVFQGAHAVGEAEVRT